MEKKIKGFTTRAIHNSHKRPVERPLASPIHLSSSFYFDTIEQAEKAFSLETDDYVYTRGNNPTIKEFERNIANLEEGAGAVAFASGMAAISSVLMSLVKAGDKIIAHHTLYGSTYSVLRDVLGRYGVEVIFTDFRSNKLGSLIDSKVKALYMETPCNPTLDILDIAKISALAKVNSAKLVVDNTFATPFFQRPLTLGADIVVHSATKYICGHGDAIGGVAISKDMEYLDNLRFGWLCELGGIISPFNSWLMNRGLKTLELRMLRHEENAKKLSAFLRNHPKVEKVYYPGLEDFQYHEIAKKQMTGFGGILSFELKNRQAEEAIKLVETVDLMKLAVSLGDVESLIEMPMHMTHRSYEDKDLEKFSLNKNLIRISTGLENTEDLIEDLNQALVRIGG